MYLCQIFVKNAKMTLELYLNGQNRKKFENWENAEILVITVKVAFFGHSKRQNSAVFQDRDLKFCAFIYLQAFFYTYSVFFSSPNSELFKNEGSI